MAVPKIDMTHGGTLLPSTGLEPDARTVGFWWSDADWQWWPVSLAEVREASGNTSMGSKDAMSYVTANWGLDLRLSIPRDKGRPGLDTQISSGSGRTEAPSGGGRGGAAAATFVPQDEATVREQVRNYIINVTGTSDERLIALGVKEFMSRDRASFGARDTQGIDPWQAMKEVIRATQAYRDVNDARPDSVDEMDWVTTKQAKLRSLGLSAARAEDVGIDQASAGGSDEALIGAGQIAQQQGTGRLLESHRASLKQSASAVLGLF